MRRRILRQTPFGGIAGGQRVEPAFHAILFRRRHARSEFFEPIENDLDFGVRAGEGIRLPRWDLPVVRRTTDRQGRLVDVASIYTESGRGSAAR